MNILKLFDMFEAIYPTPEGIHFNHGPVGCDGFTGQLPETDVVLRIHNARWNAWKQLAGMHGNMHTVKKVKISQPTIGEYKAYEKFEKALEDHGLTLEIEDENEEWIIPELRSCVDKKVATANKILDQE